MTQYRADQAKETSLSVTLSMSPVNAGSSHFTCNPPTGSTGGSSSDGSGGTVNTSFTMSGLLGHQDVKHGVQAEVSGCSMIYLLQQLKQQTRAAYGNPFNIT